MTIQRIRLKRCVWDAEVVAMQVHGDEGTQGTGKLAEQQSVLKTLSSQCNCVGGDGGKVVGTVHTRESSRVHGDEQIVLRECDDVRPSRR